MLGRSGTWPPPYLGSTDIIGKPTRILQGMARVRSGQALWGSITLSRPLTCNVMAGRWLSCRLFVLVDQPAKELPVSYHRHRQVGDRDSGDVGALRWPQVPGPVRAMAVIVRDVLTQDCAQALPGGKVDVLAGR